MAIDSQISDPFQVLGLARSAIEAEVRARYLELVKQYPPDREPDKFRQIRSAYEATSNPLILADRLLDSFSDELDWHQAIDSQKAKLPRLSPEFMLSLGNRAAKP